MNDKIFEFHAVIIKNPDMDAAYVEFPYDVEKAFGKKRVKVDAWFDGVAYSGILCRMGTEKHIIGIRKDIRQKIGKEAGDVVAVRIRERE